MDWIIANWEYCLIGFYTLEKVVKITPVKWDDILVDGLKAIVTGVVSKKQTLK